MAASKIRKFKHNFQSSNPLNSAPTLSPELQTSLLQVGMRVRKSIGQGYRTQWALEEEKMRLGRAQSYKSNSATLLWEDEESKAEQDENASFPGSQESTSSVESITKSAVRHIPKPSRKRSYDKEDEVFSPILEQMDATSTCLRPIAQATSRRRFVPSRNASAESVKKVDMIPDFEDAVFLDSSNQNNGITDHIEIDVDF